jgi:hypothetical protein
MDSLRGLATISALLALGIAVSGCRPSPGGWTLGTLELPRAYRAEASGEIRIDDLRLPGRVRVDYLVYPDNRVVMQSLHAWIRDVDIVTRFAFIEVSRERLRCTEFSNEDIVFGTHDPAGSKLTFPAGAARMTGHSYTNRAPDRSCLTPVRQLTAQNDREIVVTHDPEANAFGLNAAFRASYDGNDVGVGITAEGGFLNRPPEPLIGVGGPSIPIDLIQGGCPEILPLNPPGAAPNDPRGLVLNLVSNTTDPDGSWNRSDIVREEWSHSAGRSASPFRLIGEGRVAGPYLFASDQEHWLMLTAWDRTGASYRDVCFFRVLRPDEVPRP